MPSKETSVLEDLLMREAWLDERSKIDFVVNLDGKKVGVEAKISSASVASVERQLVRYGCAEVLDELVLVGVGKPTIKWVETKAGFVSVHFVDLSLNALL